MEDWLKYQINPLVKYRQNQTWWVKYVHVGLQKNVRYLKEIDWVGSEDFIHLQ